MRSVGKLYSAVVLSLATFAAVLLLLVMLAVTVDVIMRYFVKAPLFWVGEMAEYALLYMTFTGTAWVLTRDAHISIDIVTHTLSDRRANIAALVSNGICIFVCAVLTYWGAGVAWDNLKRGVHNPTLLEFPKGWLLAVIPVGFFLLLIQFLKVFSVCIGRIRKREPL